MNPAQTWQIQLSLHRKNGFDLEVDLHLPATGCTVVFGPSGCGKSTLLRSVAGLEAEARGRHSLGDCLFQDDTQKVNLPCHQRRLGVVFQTGALFSHLDVAGNLGYARRRHGTQINLHQELIQLMDLSALLKRRTEELSGGERQRVALARALLAQPQALLLDEPLASLDRSSRRSIYPYFDRLQKVYSLPSLYVTHDLAEAARLGDHLVVLDSGRVKSRGDLASTLSDPEAGLATGETACSVISARVQNGPDNDGLLLLKKGQDRWWVPGTEEVAGQEVRLLVWARDISLTWNQPGATSILNVLPVTVQALWEDGPTRMMARLQADSGTLLAAVTKRSALNLELAPGKKLFAQVKSLALL